MKFLLTIFTGLLVFSVYSAENLRIVSLAPALTEIVCHLGGESHLAGRSAACDYPASVKKLPAVGRFGIPEIERIIACKPSWVIGNDMMNPNVAAKLRDLGIEVHIAQINSLEDYLFWLKLIGKKLNQPERAAAEVAEVAKYQELLKKSAPLKCRTLWVVNEKPLIVAGAGTLPDKNISLMQLTNAAAEHKGYFKCSAEWLLSQKIDLIIWNIPGDPRPNPLWRKVKAVRENQVILLDIYNPSTRPGPRYLPSVMELRRNIEKVVIR